MANLLVEDLLDQLSRPETTPQLYALHDLWLRTSPSALFLAMVPNAIERLAPFLAAPERALRQKAAELVMAVVTLRPLEQRRCKGFAEQCKQVRELCTSSFLGMLDGERIPAERLVSGTT